MVNRLFSKEQFWDGRAADLEDQVHGPLMNPLEMGMPSDAEVAARVRAITGYPPLFRRAFGDERIEFRRIAEALAAYERTVVSGDSPYDRYLAGDATALSDAQQRGLAVFLGRGRCSTCHVGFNFTDESYRNLGVGAGQPEPDLGRYVVTKRDEDRGAFKTPTLRNVALTAPYMHDGSEATLLDVVEFYDRGGNPNAWLSKDMQPLSLSAQEKRDLVAFMEALTGPIVNGKRRRELREVNQAGTRRNCQDEVSGLQPATPSGRRAVAFGAGPPCYVSAFATRRRRWRRGAGRGRSGGRARTASA